MVLKKFNHHLAYILAIIGLPVKSSATPSSQWLMAVIGALEVMAISKGKTTSLAGARMSDRCLNEQQAIGKSSFL